MANSPLWQILWVIAAVIAGAVMFGAWTGPHRSVSNLSRWATRLHIRLLPAWLRARAADRWAFRGGLVTLVLLLAAAWLIPSQLPSLHRLAFQQRRRRQRRRRAGPAGANAPYPSASRPAYRCRFEKCDPGARSQNQAGQARGSERRSGSRSIFLGDRRIPPSSKATRSCRRCFLRWLREGKRQVGTSIYPDEKDPNIIVIRIGLNDRS